MHYTKTVVSLIFAFFVFGCNLTAQNISAMSYNIRYDNPNDGPDAWSQRKDDLLQLINHYSPDFLGIQEGLEHQVKYIAENNSGNYTFVGVGRDDDISKGEYCAIYYDTTQYTLISSETFWLSPTPDSISVGWDASMERICTHGQFRDRTGTLIHVYNAHLDHRGKSSRLNSMRLITDRIKRSTRSGAKVILMGDFNARPTSPPIKHVEQFLKKHNESSTPSLYGPRGTYNDFDPSRTEMPTLDYIYAINMDVLKYRHIDDRRPNGRWVSDHLPVMVVLRYK